MNRRQFGKGTAAAAAGLVFSLRGWAAGYDLVIRNVQALIGGSFRRADLGIRGGKIVAVAEPGTLGDARELIVGDDFYASPGWVDLHVHYVGLKDGKTPGSPLSRLGAAHGVTALLDAGTTGPYTYHRLEHAVGDSPEVPCYALLNVVGDGIQISKFYNTREGWADIPAMEKVAADHPRIVGVKVRADHQVAPRTDRLHYVKKLREAGDALGLPAMAHIGGPPPYLVDMLPYLKEGDIVTHFLRGRGNSIIGNDGKLHDAVKDAYARGVKFDLANGAGSFEFNCAERALEQGFLDFTVSSDLYILSAPLHARTFANVLTQLLALKMPLADLVERASTRPGRFLGLEREIKEGAEATLSVFSLAEGEFVCKDVTGDSRMSDRRIIPEWTVLQGKPVRAGDLDRKLFL